MQTLVFVEIIFKFSILYDVIVDVEDKSDETVATRYDKALMCVAS